MLSFYRDIGYRMLISCSTAAFTVEATIGVAFWLLALFNQTLARTVSDWNGFNPAWSVAVLGLVAAHLFLKAIYQKYQEIELAKAASEHLAEERHRQDEQRAELLASQISELTARIEGRERAAKRRMQIAALIESGNAIVTKLIHANRDDENLAACIHDETNWLEQAREFVRADSADFLSWFDSDAGLHGNVIAGSRQRSRHYNFMHNRIARLNELKDRLPNS